MPRKRLTIDIPEDLHKSIKVDCAEQGNTISNLVRELLERPRKEEQAPAVPLKRLTIDLPENLHRRVKVGCASRGIKMVDLVRELLERNFPA